jgi:hypothetical protein
VTSGEYRIFVDRAECGAERWSITPAAEGWVVTGEQILEAPHPFPSRHEYRATLDERWRLTGIDVVWTVAERRVVATHRAGDGRWRVRIEYQGQVREQEGDYPEFCEVEYASILFNGFMLARRDFQLGGEHEFPLLRIGPPLMAVTPERMLMRCVEVGTFQAPSGPVKAKRYVVSLPPRSEDEGYTFWADEDGLVLEAYEGLDLARPWMRLVGFSS